MSKLVHLSWPAEAVAELTLDAPDYRNHITLSAAKQLHDGLIEAREAGARVVVLSSAVEGLWFQHAWLDDLVALGEGREGTDEPTGFFGVLRELTKERMVSIAAISGNTSGGGLEFGWACDLRVAETQAQFSQPEVRIGVGTGIGGTSRLMRLIGRTVTAEMVLDGLPVSAQRLYQLGGINRVVPEGCARDEAVAWALRLADHPPAALQGMKQMLNEAQENHLQAAVMRDQEIFQSFSYAPEALATMKAASARMADGEDMKEVYWPEIAK